MQRSHKMSRCFLSAMAGTALLLSLPAHAEDTPPPPPGGGAMMMMEGPMHKGPPETLAEARERAKQHLEILNSMTEEQWQQSMKIRQEMNDKWESMTPEEKEAFKELLDKGVEITTILVPSAPKSYLKDSLA